MASAAAGSTSLVRAAGRYLSKQLSKSSLSPALGSVSATHAFEFDTDDLEPSEIRRLQKAVRKTERAMR